MSRSRIISGIALAVALAACGEAGRDPLGPDGPSMNGGLVVGGNRSDSTSTTPTTSGTDSTSLENGGLVVGGN